MNDLNLDFKNIKTNQNKNQGLLQLISQASQNRKTYKIIGKMKLIFVYLY
jgi:hypothetical protein